MIVGVYGLGYAIAMSDPIRHWPIVLVGLLGKLFGPIGFNWAASKGELPWNAGLTIVTNDLIPPTFSAPSRSIEMRSEFRTEGSTGLRKNPAVAPTDVRSVTSPEF